MGSDDERSQGGRHVPNHAPTVASSVLNQNIAGRQRHLRAIVELECKAAGENDPEIRRVGPVKAGVSSTEFVAILEVHLGSGLWCNEVSRRVRPDDEADRGTKGPCSESRNLPARFRPRIFDTRPPFASGVRVPFATLSYQASETTCDRSFPAMVFL